MRITNEQIERLGSEAADAGDIEQHAICQLALGAREYSDAGWLNDNTCLDAAERRRMGRLTVADAHELCVEALSSQTGNPRESGADREAPCEND